MAISYIKVFFDWEEQASRLTDEEFGSLIRGLIDYARGGEVRELKGNAHIMLPVFQKYVDCEAAAYDEVVRKRREAGRKGGLAKASNAKQSLANDSKTYQEKEKEQEQEKEKEKEKEYISSPLPCGRGAGMEDIERFIKLKGLTCDAREFFDYYESKGWTVHGEPIRDWKALLISWDKAANKKAPPSYSDNETFDINEFAALALRHSYGDDAKLW